MIKKEININITQRLDWLESRMELKGHERDYIRFQMKELAKEVSRKTQEHITIKTITKLEREDCDYNYHGRCDCTGKNCEFNS